MIILGMYFVVVGIWTAIEIYQAPEMDQQGKITKPGKKLSDLWRKRR